MLEVIGAIRVEVAPNGISAQPVARPVIQFPVREQGSVRGLVHQDCEAELAGGNQKQRGENREQIWPDGDERHRGEHDAPVEYDRCPALPVCHREPRVDLVPGDEIAPGDLRLRQCAHGTPPNYFTRCGRMPPPSNACPRARRDAARRSARETRPKRRGQAGRRRACSRRARAARVR